MTTNDPFEYDVALSFAGEDREIANKLARMLKARNIRVFYDEHEAAELWGKDLIAHLADLYENKARYCVMLISKHYHIKRWTNLERRHIQARAFRDVKEYILPIRIDDTEIPGLAETIAYIDTRRHSLKSIASLLEQKLLKAKEVDLGLSAGEAGLGAQDSTTTHQASTSASTPAKTAPRKQSATIIAAWIGLAGAILLAIATLAVPVIERWLNPLPVTPPDGQPTSTAPPSASLFGVNNVCGGEGTIADEPIGIRFRRWQGVSLFAVENAPERAILSNEIRAMTIDQRGLWLGYFTMPDNPPAGLGLFDKVNWYSCNIPEGVNGGNVNDIAIDQQGRVWVALESAGVAVYDGETWTRFTRSDGLISEDVFRITIDANGVIWVGTWEGVAKYDGTNWSTPYSAENGTLQNSHIAAILFDPQGNIWLGHIDRGISLYNNSEGKWEVIQAGEDSLGGNKVRALALQAADEQGPEAVWVATADGGLSRYSNGIWTQYHVQDGLLSEDVKDVKIDPLNRVWAATSEGVVYLQDGRWIVYDTYDTARIAFGVNCRDTTCPYDQDHILTATSGSGFTHSRLPRPNMLDVIEVCFVIDNQERTCVSPMPADAPNTVEATLPTPVAPGQAIRFEIVVSPRSPYQLREDRGDLLSFAEESDANLFGAYTQIAVKGTADSGQKYIFTDYDNPIIVPQADVSGQEFTSTWRVWLHTRYAGPIIRLEFAVHKPN